MTAEMDKQFMARCLQLAKRGAGVVAPNPMVGAVLVHNGRIIGEGYHQKYGVAHAEVNCITDASRNAPELIPASTLYVSLEPCAHFGKTPPCADLIISKNIPKVVIACRDSFERVNGLGIKKLLAAGIEITEDVLHDDAMALNRRFFTFHQHKRPYVVLKWAQTNNDIIASQNNERLLISNTFTNRLVHKWRSEESGILIGANTALKDDPLLDIRNWYGKAPVKIVIDPNLRCGTDSKLFRQGEKVILINSGREEEVKNIHYLKVKKENFITEMLDKLYELNIQSILVEGGKQTLQSFIDAGSWDEARVITNSALMVNEGLPAPELTNALKLKEEAIFTDRIEYFKNQNNNFINSQNDFF